ncbi:hypothetical protein GCM10027202_15480 [Microvirgula curvata]
MIRDQFLLGMDNEIIVDLFAGGGGMSTAIEQALGRHVDIAINHDMDAISMHCAGADLPRHADHGHAASRCMILTADKVRPGPHWVRLLR